MKKEKKQRKKSHLDCPLKNKAPIPNVKTDNEIRYTLTLNIPEFERIALMNELKRRQEYRKNRVRDERNDSVVQIKNYELLDEVQHYF